MGKIRIVIADENEVYRTGLAAALATEEFEVVAHVASIAALKPLLKDCAEPDLILFDLPEEGHGLPAALRDISTLQCPSAKLVLLPTVLSPQRLASAIRARTNGMLLKTISITALRHALLLISMGIDVFPALEPDDTEAPTIRSPLRKLSRRERMILEFVSQDRNDPWIAESIGLSVGTVRLHLKNARKKLGLKSREEAVQFGIDNGLGH